MKTKKLIVFTIGGKGGVGKSWIMTLLLDLYESLKVPFRALDLDNENNTLTRFFRSAEFVEISSEQDLDSMMNRIVEGDCSLTVMDMRAASTDRIEPWLRRVDFEALDKVYGVRFTAIGVVDSSDDSAANIGFWARDVLKNSKLIRFVIAKNKVRGEINYENSVERKQYQDTLDVVEIEIPKLEDWVHGMLEARDLRLNAALAIQDVNDPLTKFMTRSRIRKYQEAVFEQFERARERLLP
jgi:hypothetical protein